MKAKYGLVNNKETKLYENIHTGIVVFRLGSLHSPLGIVVEAGEYDGCNYGIGELIEVWTSFTNTSAWTPLDANTVTFTW